MRVGYRTWRERQARDQAVVLFARTPSAVTQTHPLTFAPLFSLLLKVAAGLPFIVATGTIVRAHACISEIEPVDNMQQLGQEDKVGGAVCL